jgi:ATP-binding cassette subfamily B protein
MQAGCFFTVTKSAGYTEQEVEEQLSKQSYDPRLLRRLLALVVPYWPAVLAALVCLLGNSALQVVSPLLTKVAIDKYLAPGHGESIAWLEQWLPAGASDGLRTIALWYLTAIALALLFEFSEQYLMQRTGQRAMFDLRRRLYGHLQQLDIAYFDRNPVGRLVTRVTTDVDALNEMFASGIVTVMGDVLVLTAIFLAMFRLNSELALLMLAVLPLVFGVTVLFRRAVQASNRLIRIAVARINAFLQEHVSGMTVLQLFNREERAARDFEAVNRQHLEAYRGAIQAYGWFYPAVEFLSTLSLVAILMRGGWQVREGALTLGVVVAFFQYGMRIFRPIQDLSEKYNIMQSALAAAERIFQLLDEPVRVNNPKEAKPFPTGPAAIEFDGVWFAYNDEDWVLRDVSFRIEPGETIAVVGHTGAGKTTLTNLLLRFYDIQRGSIRLGGTDIRELNLAELRRHFAIVLQDPTLFTGTLAENIRLGTEAIGDGGLRDAAEQVNLSDFVQSLPGGFLHEVRERGAGLSTGQKQLISFARALAHDPDFLILDEATSSVDTETEQKVREALDHMVAGRTSLIIAHRLSTVQRADRILVMHKGKLREQGTHQQLLAARGIYWKLYQLQYKDQEASPRA